MIYLIINWYQIKPLNIAIFFQVTMGTDYFSNVMTMFAHFRSNLYHFIDAPVDKTTYTWNLISFPFTVNAFHLQQLNSIGKSY